MYRARTKLCTLPKEVHNLITDLSSPLLTTMHNAKLGAVEASPGGTLAAA